MNVSKILRLLRPLLIANQSQRESLFGENSKKIKELREISKKLDKPSKRPAISWRYSTVIFIRNTTLISRSVYFNIRDITFHFVYERISQIHDILSYLSLNVDNYPGPATPNLGDPDPTPGAYLSNIGGALQQLQTTCYPNTPWVGNLVQRMEYSLPLFLAKDYLSTAWYLWL